MPFMQCDLIFYSLEVLSTKILRFRHTFDCNRKGQGERGFTILFPLFHFRHRAALRQANGLLQRTPEPNLRAGDSEPVNEFIESRSADLQVRSGVR